ncbi:hypothetical protein UFOVP325_145 [uncultured Caudovirales phage]|uniref:Uncharacterized protein n=1 Tax=uncultured Caudovirales phage TaxID=2100421 RepID=A0A6J5MTB4_9CAUD|nr:hypothetical protein UFOVP325_145 [uncultured Caudovirales phage]CAB4148180.1 hypothetical protein UFOVP430_140 [uncultured Caudovirales phage]
MATTASLISRVRLELGDMGKTFVSQFVADGTTNRFKLHYSPLDATSVVVFNNGTEVTTQAHVEESTGVLVLDFIPADGDELTVSGLYYRYFTDAELTSLITDAVLQHSSSGTDALGRKINVSNLPQIEEYPVTIYAVTLALYTLATDASFDIDIAAPDGVSIPRSERYRQLMDMVAARQSQYRDLCTHLGVGLYKIDVFTFRRISKATNRYVPVYKPQEVDDRSWPQRVDIPAPIYGDKTVPWITEGGDLTAYQGRAYSTALVYTDNFAGKLFTAKLLHQRGSLLPLQNFTLEVDVLGTDVVTAAARTSGSTTVTFTTSAAHGLTAGTAIVVTDVDSSADGYYTVVGVPNTTSFTVTGIATTALALTGLTGQVETNATKEYTFHLSLEKDQTLRLAERTYWSLSTVDFFTGESIEYKGGSFFNARRSTVVI